MSKLTPTQKTTLRTFRGTGRSVGKDALWKMKYPKPDTQYKTLYSLRRKGFLEHAIANQWYLTDKGRDFVYRGIE